MIRSDSFKNNIAAYSTLQIPSLGTLPPIRNGGNLVYDNSNKTFNYSNGSEWVPVYGGSPFPGVIITVHPTSIKADFKTIKEALAEATSLLPTISSVLVYPSTYVEDNPLIVPNGISVVGFTGPLAITVVAANPGSDLFQVGNGCLLDTLTMFGGNIAVNYDGSTGSKAGSILRACVIVDSTIGVRSCVGPGELFCVQTLVRSLFGSVTKGFECITGGKMRCFTSGGFGLPLNPVGIGISCEDVGSLLVFFSGGFQECVTMAVVDNAGRLEIKSAFIRDSDTALKVDSTGTTSILLVSDATILNSAIYDLDIQSTNATVEISGGTLRTDLINNPNNVTVFSNSFSTEPNNEAEQILGELHVGSHLQGTESAMGQGDAYVNGMTVLTFDGATFMNITTAAKSPTISTPFLSGLIVGNIIYIGRVTQFFGFNITVNSTWAVGDSDKVIAEFWNGVAWTSFDKMVTNASPPYSSRTDVMLEVIETQRIRFGKLTSWTTVAVNSITAFWVRFRVAVLLTGPIPTFSRIEVHPSTTKINSDGYLEYFGNARPIKLIPWDLGLLRPAAASPGIQDVFIGQTLDIGKNENLFVNAETDRSGFNTFLPQSIDTSYGVKFRWSWRSTATGGSIDWVIRWGWTSDGFDIYTTSGTAPVTGVNQQTLTFSTAVTAAIGTQVTEFRILSIPKVNARPASGNPDMIWITIQRTIGDSHTGNVAFIQVQGEYIAWCEGGYITDF